MPCRTRWVEALQAMEPGPMRDLVDAAGTAMSLGVQGLTNLARALDSVVDDVLDGEPSEMTSR